MKGTYWQKGEALDYLNNTGEKIEHGDVVKLGKRIGIAGDDIPPGESGAVHVTGVFAFKRADAEDITMGEEVYFTDAGITIQATTQVENEDKTVNKTENIRAGYVAGSSNGDTVYVKINA